MKNDFKEVMEQKSNEELAKILKLQKDDYQPEAIKCAELEFSKRNLSLDSFVLIETSADRSQEKYIPKSYREVILPVISILVLLALGFFMIKDPYLMENVDEEGRKMFFRVILKAVWGVPAGVIAVILGSVLLYIQIKMIKKIKRD